MGAQLKLDLFQTGETEDVLHNPRKIIRTQLVDCYILEKKSEDEVIADIVEVIAKNPPQGISCEQFKEQLMSSRNVLSALARVMTDALVTEYN